ncbi:hypothetical protein HMPREF3159_13575 [Brachybacterium sp. HMSC06H03]|uniref:hypothetical protein n=1 Tax=Brachybacterium sp. HMSC06H03 TaxID=1581127 RepID=UPI0008A261E2|nr:hypothetical protein [Brachybacterium sp. HMSC06H03]OFT48022.1 hypothetical protein HMPREF3159_13575 [Brachybacterium sp. HMSC06H03]
MDPRPDIHLGHEMTPTTHTGPIPVVSRNADAGQRDSSARTTAAVVAALVLAFIGIVLMGL